MNPTMIQSYEAVGVHDLSFFKGHPDVGTCGGTRNGHLKIKTECPAVEDRKSLHQLRVLGLHKNLPEPKREARNKSDRGPAMVGNACVDVIKKPHKFAIHAEVVDVYELVLGGEVQLVCRDGFYSE